MYATFFYIYKEIKKNYASYEIKLSVRLLNIQNNMYGFEVFKENRWSAVTTDSTELMTNIHLG